MSAQRRLLVAGGMVLLGTHRFSRAQPAATMTLRRLGVLLYDAEPAWAFLRLDLAPALSRLGWHEGRNLVSDWRFAEGDAARLPALAQALIRGDSAAPGRDGADVLLTRGTPATRALQQVTTRVPIVTGVGDPVGAGFAASLAAPGGNITGLSWAQVEMTQKRLELLRELVPKATQLLVLVPANHAPSISEMVPMVERAARGLGLAPQLVLVSRVEPLRQALRAAREQHAPGTVAGFAFSVGSMDPKDLALAALHQRVPTVFDQRGYVESSGLMSYRMYWDDQTRRTAEQLDQVLRGRRPDQMPFEQPTRSELVINARSARMLGLAIPPGLRARADELIE